MLRCRYRHLRMFMQIASVQVKGVKFAHTSPYTKDPGHAPVRTGSPAVRASLRSSGCHRARLGPARFVGAQGVKGNEAGLMPVGVTGAYVTDACTWCGSRRG